MKKGILFFLIMGMCFIGTSIAEPVIIVNNSVSDQSIDTATIKKIYLGKMSRWDNGDKIVMVALDGGTVHDQFLEKYVQKSAKQFDSFWKKMFFTGSGVPPKSFASEAEVVAFVSTTNGAIGYIDSEMRNDNVTVIK